MNQPIAINVAGLHKNFGDKEVLTGVNLQVESGTAVGLLGQNGSGKTTLIKCCLGLLRRTSGSVAVLGDQVWHLSAESKARLGYVRQYGFSPTPVWANLAVVAVGLSALVILGNSAGFVMPKTGPGGSPIYLLILIMMLMIFPCAAGYIQLLQRWPRMEGELLRPQTRREYIDGLHLAVLRSALVSDGVFLVWLAAMWLLVAQIPLVTIDVLMGLLLVLAIQAFLLPLGVLFAVLFRNIVGYVAFTSLALLSFISVGVWLEKRNTWGHLPFVVLAAVLVLLGACVWRAARVRWLEAELG